jgi:hypothetical protein
MNAVLAIISDGGQVIVVIDREAVEINYFLLWFINSNKTLQRRPWPTPSPEAAGGGVCSSDKTMPLEGQTAPSWWGVCVLVFCPSERDNEVIILIYHTLPRSIFLTFVRAENQFRIPR